MIGSVLVCSTILAFQAAGPPQSRDVQKPKPKAAVEGDPRRPGKITAASEVQKPAPKPAVEVDPGEALAEYNALRAKTPSTAAAQWKLGLWCEEHGLKAEAYVHFSEVVRLDPRREGAWRRLGFKKVHGRWTTDAQIAEASEQKKADKLWVPKLKKLHKDIHGKNGAKKQDAAQAALLAITDPRAIVAVYREFGGGQLDQTILIQVLSQVDRPISSKILAILSIYGKTPQVRGRATEILRRRPADDFVDVLVGMMIDPLNYEVRHVGGPGSPGVIFVEGERANVARFYAPPPPPNVAPGPGDIISFDSSGMPLIMRPVASNVFDARSGVPGSKTLVKETIRTNTTYVAISPSQLMLEAQKGAVMAEAQLKADVAQIESINQDRKRFNDVVMAVATDATGKDHGKTPKEWREALAGGNNSSKRPSRTPQKPTIPEAVPLAYNPVFAPVGFTAQALTQTRVFEDS